MSGLLLGAMYAAPTLFILERVLLAAALKSEANLPCTVTRTEVHGLNTFISLVVWRCGITVTSRIDTTGGFHACSPA